jgi:hypothetical protein
MKELAASHQPDIQRMIDGMTTPLKLKELMKGKIHFEINGKRQPGIEAKLKPLIDRFGEETVMKGLSQIIDDLNDGWMER